MFLSRLKESLGENRNRELFLEINGELYRCNDIYTHKGGIHFRSYHIISDSMRYEMDGANEQIYFETADDLLNELERLNDCFESIWGEGPIPCVVDVDDFDYGAMSIRKNNASIILKANC